MAKKPYYIESVNKRTLFDRAGGTDEVYEVNFRAATGAFESVQFSIEDYTPENVKKRLTELAELHKTIVEG